MKEGDRVIKDSGDYTYEGTIVADFNKKSGIRRFVVEHDELGLLFVFNEQQLRVIN